MCSNVVYTNDVINLGDILALQELTKCPTGFNETDDSGWYPLHKAAVQPMVKVLEKVMNASFMLSLEEKTLMGETPLTLAVMARLVDNVTLLLDHGVSPHTANSKNETPLLLAVRYGSYDVAAALLRGGASVEQVCLKRWTAMHEAAKMGCPDIMVLLLQHGGRVTEIDQDGVTPMAIAVEYAHSDVLEILIHNGGNVNAQAPNGDSVLFDAAGSGSLECIELLLQNGANPNVPSLCSQLPIHRAAYLGHYLALKTFIPVTTRRAIRLSGQSPIHSAADGGQVQCLELLMEKGFDVNSLLDFHISENYGDMRKSALYFAVSNGDVTCTKMLLNAGAKPDLDPLRCLLVAVRAGRYEIVKLLLASQADVNCYFTVVSDTVFPTALQYCLQDQMMMRLLLNSGYEADKCFSCNHDNACNDLTDQADSDHQEKIPFCDFVSVSWLVHLAGRAVWMLLHYVSNVSLCPNLRLILEKKDKWPDLCYICENPRSLTHLCRLMIRKMMTPKRLGDPNIWDSFPLPPRLIEYLNHENDFLYSQT
ncbi:hypothetical protein UPYG_G00262170 [Umbra pygmaea]|uniref:SOCS box domain-containing protein n=1 Tax=Umbra pygmaea TaxID=75934 RepID=A0ABD0W979_UMBPY